MADQGLKAETPLAGFSHDFGAVHLQEVTGLSVVSLAISDGQSAALAKKLKAGYGATLPAVGQSSRLAGDTGHIISVQPDQYLIIFEHSGDFALEVVQEKLADTAYMTDQSDSSAILRISGDLMFAALERICNLDLDPGVFAVGSCSRTLMEHMGVVIFKESEDSFTLMSATSSADSFLHAVETSAAYVT